MSYVEPEVETWGPFAACCMLFIGSLRILEVEDRKFTKKSMFRDGTVFFSRDKRNDDEIHRASGKIFLKFPMAALPLDVTEGRCLSDAKFNIQDRPRPFAFQSIEMH